MNQMERLSQDEIVDEMIKAGVENMQRFAHYDGMVDAKATATEELESDPEGALRVLQERPIACAEWTWGSGILSTVRCPICLRSTLRGMDRCLVCRRDLWVLESAVHDEVVPWSFLHTSEASTSVPLCLRDKRLIMRQSRVRCLRAMRRTTKVECVDDEPLMLIDVLIKSVTHSARFWKKWLEDHETDQRMKFFKDQGPWGIGEGTVEPGVDEMRYPLFYKYWFEQHGEEDVLQRRSLAKQFVAEVIFWCSEHMKVHASAWVQEDDNMRALPEGCDPRREWVRYAITGITHRSRCTFVWQLVPETDEMRPLFGGDEDEVSRIPIGVLVPFADSDHPELVSYILKHRLPITLKQQVVERVQKLKEAEEKPPQQSMFENRPWREDANRGRNTRPKQSWTWGVTSTHWSPAWTAAAGATWGATGAKGASDDSKEETSSNVLIYVVLVAYTLVVVAVTLGCVLLC